MKFLKIGSDPEFFVVNKTTQLPVSGIPYIPGQKFTAFSLDDVLGQGFTIQKDNVLAEACVPPVIFQDVTAAAALMHHNISKFVAYTNNYILASKITGKELELATKASFTLDPSELSDPEAKVFGCTESMNAWTMGVNPTPEAKDPNFRSAGGHIHISYEDPVMFYSYKIIQLCDLFLGVPSILRDPDVARRELYGKAGECRITSYGCEYRTLSNYWVNNEAETHFLFNQLKKVEENFDMEISDELSLKIQICINTNNSKLAQEIIEEYSILTEVTV